MGGRGEKGGGGEGGEGPRAGEGGKKKGCVKGGEGV